MLQQQTLKRSEWNRNRRSSRSAAERRRRRRRRILKYSRKVLHGFWLQTLVFVAFPSEWDRAKKKVGYLNIRNLKRSKFNWKISYSQNWCVVHIEYASRSASHIICRFMAKLFWLYFTKMLQINNNRLTIQRSRGRIVYFLLDCMATESFIEFLFARQHSIFAIFAYQNMLFGTMKLLLWSIAPIEPKLVCHEWAALEPFRKIEIPKKDTLRQREWARSNGEETERIVCKCDCPIYT